MGTPAAVSTKAGVMHQVAGNAGEVDVAVAGDATEGDALHL